LLSVFFITGCISKAKIKNQNLLVFQKRINEFVYDGFSFKLGGTQSEITRALGEPYEENSNTYVYQTDEAPSIIVFHIRNSNVYRIDWEFYYD